MSSHVKDLSDETAKSKLLPLCREHDGSKDLMHLKLI